MQHRKLYAAVAAALATCPLAHAAVEEMPSTLKTSSQWPSQSITRTWRW